jgi:hypothetical protein
MSSTVVADAKFLRRVLFGLIGLTLITGVVAGFTTVNAMNASPTACVTGCN